MNIEGCTTHTRVGCRISIGACVQSKRRPRNQGVGAATLFQEPVSGTGPKLLQELWGGLYVPVSYPPSFLLRLSRFLKCDSCYVACWFLLHPSPLVVFGTQCSVTASPFAHFL